MKFQYGNYSELFSDWKNTSQLDGQYPWDAFASIFPVNDTIILESKLIEIGF